MKRQNKNSAQDSFTLIELLVVIAIIAMLAAMLFPSLNKARDTAKAATCMSNMRQWGVAINLFCQDNSGMYPEVPKGSGTSGWYDYVYPYLNSCTNSFTGYFWTNEDLLRNFIGLYCPTTKYIESLPRANLSTCHYLLNY